MLTERTEPGLVTLYDIRTGMERVYSYNPGTRTGLMPQTHEMTHLYAYLGIN